MGLSNRERGNIRNVFEWARMKLKSTWKASRFFVRRWAAIMIRVAATIDWHMQRKSWLGRSESLSLQLETHRPTGDPERRSAGFVYISAVAKQIIVFCSPPIFSFSPLQFSHKTIAYCRKHSQRPGPFPLHHLRNEFPNLRAARFKSYTCAPPSLIHIFNAARETYDSARESHRIRLGARSRFLRRHRNPATSIQQTQRTHGCH